MSKTPFDAERGKSLLKFDPNDLYIETNPKHPLYQRRADDPPDEALVQSIMEQGIVVPVLIVRGPDGKPWVEAGTRRTIAAREANRRLRAKRQEPKMVPAVFRDEKADEGIGVKLIENALRRDLTISQRAEEARLALVAGYTEEQVAGWLGCTKQTIENYRVLAQSHRSVQKAVDDGTVRLTDAVRQLGRLPENDQPAALKKLQAEKPTRVARKQERDATGKKGPVQVSPIRRFKKLVKFVNDDSTAVQDQSLVVLLGWLEGHLRDDQLIERFPDLTPFFEQKRKTEKAA